jgi:hypothetical protein
MAIKTLFVNTIGESKVAVKVTQDGGVIRAKGTPKPDVKSHDAWRLYFELQSWEQLQRLHTRLEEVHQTRADEPGSEELEDDYYV